MKRQQSNKQVVIYQTKADTLELTTDLQDETIWLAQQQMAELFDLQKAAISKHLKNIFDSEKLQEGSVVSILETTAKDKKT